MELTEQELFDTEDLIRTVHKYELLDDRDGGIEVVTKFRAATGAKVREEYAGLVERAFREGQRAGYSAASANVLLTDAQNDWLISEAKAALDGQGVEG
jgi:hypothetical protein